MPRRATDDFLETSVEPTVVSSEARVARRERLPWVLFAVTAVCFAVVTLLLARRIAAERERNGAELLKRATAEEKLKQAEVEQTLLEAKVSALEPQVKALTAERDALAKKLAEPPPAPAASVLTIEKPVVRAVKAPVKAKKKAPAKKKRRK